MMVLRLLWAQVQSSMTYRFAFLMDLLNIVVFSSMQFFSLVLIFGRFESLGGWSLGEVTLLWAIVDTGYGLSQTFFNGFDPRIFSQQIRQGTLDQIMLRPVNITIQVLTSQFEIQLLARPFKGVIIFLIAMTLLNLSWTPLKLVVLLLALMGTVLFFGALYMIGSTSSVWTVEAMDTIEMATFASKSMMNYPFHIYPTWLRRTFTYVIPAGLLNYYPALYLLGKPDPLGYPKEIGLVAPLAGFILLAAAYRFWLFGLERYQSTGS